MLLNKVNAEPSLRRSLSPGIPVLTASPVMATPAAFAAGVVAGAKASAILTGAAGVGVAVKTAQK
ncbi:hypothetical protein GB931_12695 [Modestobacter sp. I12A-02628]|uniref:Uncharacterized protein n=1 Tax=Goekera deserti TaxID=2497753 RepID=A0A7K3W9Q4_9ACTN|nr:hypothetical protein [Goekera deserti]MPQ98763.1 hypothetical protein [Goekera deserti]NDI49740.1 hypothetical protein [Goekera deserti]NEL53067.1 hypothetical protein [Goekera deserti]